VAAVAVTILTWTTAPTVTSGPPALAHLPGRQILLAAATAAQAQPKRSGIYWHVKMVFQVPHSKAQPGKALGSQETWTRRDGQQWIALTPGTVSKVAVCQRRSFSWPRTEARADSR
jgi:hypothetical protein